MQRRGKNFGIKWREKGEKEKRLAKISKEHRENIFSVQIEKGKKLSSCWPNYIIFKSVLKK